MQAYFWFYWLMLGGCWGKWTRKMEEKRKTTRCDQVVPQLHDEGMARNFHKTKWFQSRRTVAFLWKIQDKCWWTAFQIINVYETVVSTTSKSLIKYELLRKYIYFIESLKLTIVQPKNCLTFHLNYTCIVTGDCHKKHVNILSSLVNLPCCIICKILMASPNSGIL